MVLVWCVVAIGGVLGLVALVLVLILLKAFGGSGTSLGSTDNSGGTVLARVQPIREEDFRVGGHALRCFSTKAVGLVGSDQRLRLLRSALERVGSWAEESGLTPLCLSTGVSSVCVVVVAWYAAP